MACIYNADIYCDDCEGGIINDICTKLWDNREKAILPDGSLLMDLIHRNEIIDRFDLRDYLTHMDNSAYDSDDFPIHCSDEAESDVPEHCGSGAYCDNPEILVDGSKVGHFFGNDLTADGYDYVKRAIENDLLDGCTDSVACQLWWFYYQHTINLDIAQCRGCNKWDNLNDDDLCSKCGWVAMITLLSDVERDVMVRTVVTEEPLTVDYNDIETNIDYDEFAGGPPWEDCDGFEHEFNSSGSYKDSYKYVNRSYRDGGSGYIEIDDNDVVKWSCIGYSGCSKQVRFEAIARAKRATTEILVKWYEQGWESYIASAEYGDYQDSCGGIDSYEYAEKVVEECRREVACCMIHDGYIVKNIPESPKPYNRYDAFRDKIKRQLTL